MSTISISIADLGQQVAGQSFEPRFEPVPTSDVTKTNGTQRAERGKIGGSAYYEPAGGGRETYMPVVLRYVLEDGTQKEISLPNPTLAVQSRKRIVETPLTERDGTVKELISVEGYQITVRGLIIGVNNEFPEDDLIMLQQLYSQKKSVQIANVISDVFLVAPGKTAEVVITDFRLPERKGVKHVREYEMLLVNDEPFNLKEI